jgi:hypothetical protein
MLLKEICMVESSAKPAIGEFEDLELDDTPLLVDSGTTPNGKGSLDSPGDAGGASEDWGLFKKLLAAPAIALVFIVTLLLLSYKGESECLIYWHGS